jgi:K+ transporter
MSSRFISNVVLGLAGVIVVVASQAFASGVTGWVAFGVSLGALALLPLVQLDRARGRAQGVLDLLTAALALWSAVASVVFVGSTVMWLSFGEAVAFTGLAVAGLVVHELKTERVVHSFEAVPATTAAV